MLDKKEHFKKVADMLQEWDAYNDFYPSSMRGLVFSIIYLDGESEGAFCEFGAIGSWENEEQKREPFRQKTLKSLFEGYEVDFSPEEYFVTVTDPSFIEEIPELRTIDTDALSLVSTLFNELENFYLTIGADKRHPEFKERMERKKEEMEAELRNLEENAERGNGMQINIMRSINYDVNIDDIEKDNKLKQCLIESERIIEEAVKDLDGTLCDAYKAMFPPIPDLEIFEPTVEELRKRLSYDGGLGGRLFKDFRARFFRLYGELADCYIDDRHAKDVAIYCEDKSGTVIDMRINILSQKGLVKAGLWLAYIELFGGLNTY